jgi:DNA-binding winged helix-turn-helix (wHTH) protein
MEHEHLESLYPEVCRFPEIEKIISFIKEGYSCQMIAMPGVGRSIVCKFLSYNRNIRIKHLGDSQTSYHFVFVNFAEIKNRPLFDCLKFVFLELVSSLHERRLDDAFTKTDAIFKDCLSYQDELVLFQGLKRAVDFLVHEKNLHIILLFERFELYIPMLTDDFFVHLRSLRDTAKYKFSVVFSVTRPLEDLIEPAMMADFYEFFAGKLVYLTLTDMPGIKFRIEYLEKLTGKKLDSKLVKNLLTLTGGHGKLTRLATEALLATSQPLDTHHPELDSGSPDGIPGQTQNGLNELAKFLLSEKTIQSALQEIWNFLTPFDKRCILQVCNNEVCDNTSFLTQIGLYKDKLITIPLFTEFIKKNHISLQKEPITYDSSLNIIKKGPQVISESLTSSEFRLLRFLMENQEKILTREEIINAVWKDLAATAGVTDQALDQLIFRLRKKIEDNPNQPEYIQTVKGRGIKYSA